MNRVSSVLENTFNNFIKSLDDLDLETRKVINCIEGNDPVNAIKEIDAMMQHLIEIGKSRKALYYYLKDTKRGINNQLEKLNG